MASGTLGWIGLGLHAEMLQTLPAREPLFQMLCFVRAGFKVAAEAFLRKRPKLGFERGLGAFLNSSIPWSLKLSNFWLPHGKSRIKTASKAF